MQRVMVARWCSLFVAAVAGFTAVFALAAAAAAPQSLQSGRPVGRRADDGVRDRSAADKLIGPAAGRSRGARAHRLRLTDRAMSAA